LPSSRQKRRGGRSHYLGTEVFVNLVDSRGELARTRLKQLGLKVLCTNRDLPIHMSTGQPNGDFQLGTGAPLQSIQCIAGPTRPRPTPPAGDTSWRLISHLTLNYLSLLERDDDQEGAAALRELLTLYADSSDASLRTQLDGLRSVRSRPVVRRLPFSGPICFGRGLDIELVCDESCFEGSSAFLLGSVLERFFAKYVSVNSFTQTRLSSTERGEIMRWRPRIGQRHLA
jgi:type VI secretion system protein ImpG